MPGHFHLIGIPVLRGRYIAGKRQRRLNQKPVIVFDRHKIIGSIIGIFGFFRRLQPDKLIVVIDESIFTSDDR